MDPSEKSFRGFPDEESYREYEREQQRERMLDELDWQAFAGELEDDD